MKTTYIRLTILWAAISLLLPACSEEITIDTDSMESEIAIYGKITTDTMAHTILVSRTADYFSNKKTPTVSNAKVVLSDDAGNALTLAEDTLNAGNYNTPDDFYGVIGRTYFLSVTVDNKEYTSSSKINPIAKIDSIRLNYEDFGEYWNVKVWCQEPAETRDFYLFKVYLNYVLVSDSIDEWFLTDDEYFNGVNTNGISAQILQDEIPDEKVRTGDMITFEVGNINEDYFNFINEVQSETGFNHPLFDGPPANVKSNITGGARGFFAAYSIERCSYVVREEDWTWDGKF